MLLQDVPISPSKNPGSGRRKARCIDVCMSWRPGRTAQAGFGSAKRFASLARFVGRALGQIRTDDHLGHQPIGAGCQTISNARVHIEAPDLEIDHRIDVVLLLVERQPSLQRSKIGIILDPDCQILAKIAREARGRHELRPAILSKPEVDDRVDYELVITLAPSDDRPDLHVPAGLGELRHCVAELKIDAVEELPLGCVGNDKQLPDFGGIGIGRQLLINRIRRIEAHFPPVGDAPGPFASAVEGMIGDEAAGEIPNHALNGTGEWAWGITDWWEMGFYTPYAVDQELTPYSNAAKIRQLFVIPNAAEREFFYGVNFEFSYAMPQFSETRWNMEIRPIVG